MFAGTSPPRFRAARPGLHRLAVLGACVLAAVAVGGPAASAAPVTAAALAPVPAGSYNGYSSGDVTYANAANLPGADIAKASTGQSAAGVASPNGTLTTSDQLGATTTKPGQPLLLTKSKTGKTAYGHGTGLNVGIGGATTSAPPNAVAASTAEATSPPPSSATKTAVQIPADPLLSANLLTSTANANTTSNGSCVIGKDISNGLARVADANVLTPTKGMPSVIGLGGTSQSLSRTLLVKPTTAAGKTVSNPNSGLLSQTTQALAPVTLFAGTPAALKIEVLGPLQLSAEAGGQPGTSVVSYGVQGASGADPVLRITVGTGKPMELTSQQLFGNGGVVLPLGVADVTIGAPAHSLTGLEGSKPTQLANGTSASAAADFIRISVPGKLMTPGGPAPVGGPLGTVLNPVLSPVLAGLQPLTSALQAALASAGLNVADVRIGHLEASSTVPVGGIVCAAPINPLNESRKDVSATTVPAGQTFTYDIRVPNRGTSPVTNVTVDDTYAAGLQFVSSTPAPASRGTNTLHYNLGTIQPNQVVVIVQTFRVPANAPNGTVYQNDAVIRGTYQGMTLPPVTVHVPGPTVAPVGSGPCNLQHSTKFASNTQVKTGENFGYFVNVLNSGGQACTNVVVSDTLIDGVRFVSCTDGCTHSGQRVTWRIGTLQAGQSRVLSVIVKTVATSGTLPNSADVTADSGTPGHPSTGGPTVSGVSVPAPGRPASGAEAPKPAGTTGTPVTAGATRSLPTTGLPAAPAALGLSLLVGAGVLLRRRLS